MAEADAQSASVHSIQKDMKKTLLLALAVLASATFNVAFAAKKKKKDKKEAAQPVQLATSSDTLSYAIGTVMTNGLIPYLQQAEGIDTAYMADFIRGFDEMIKAADDPRFKAYSAGMGIATRLKGQMLAGMEREFTDTPDSIVPHIVFRAFTDALKGDYSLVFKMDVKSFLEFYTGIFTKAGLERVTGINQKQLWHYASGNRNPRPEQVVKIETALHKLGEELISINL